MAKHFATHRPWSAAQQLGSTTAPGPTFHSPDLTLPLPPTHPPHQQTAAAAGIGLACRSVTLDELSRLLLGGSCLIIALVDRLTLDSPSCGSTTGGGGGSTAAGGGGSTAAGGGGSPRSTHHPSGQQSVAATAPAVTATAATTEVGAASVAAANTAAAAEGTAAGSNEAAASAGGHEPEQQEGSEEEQGGEAEAAADAYVGHFIVLCGYDSGTHAFEMRDPASHRYWVLLHVWLSDRC